MCNKESGGDDDDDISSSSTFQLPFLIQQDTLGEWPGE